MISEQKRLESEKKDADTPTSKARRKTILSLTMKELNTFST
jgi:hypothetical protein